MATSPSQLTLPREIPRHSGRTGGDRRAGAVVADPADLAGLSADTVPLLEVAAVFGAPFSIDDAAAVLGQPVGRLLPALHEMLAADAVVPSRDRMAFRHEMVRRAVYARIPEPIRRALHREIGRVLLGRDDSAVAGATHLIEGTRSGGRPDTGVLDQAVRELAGRSSPAAADLALRALELTEDTDEERFSRTATAVDALVAARRIGEAGELARATLALPRLPARPAAELRLTLTTILLMSGQADQAAAEAAAMLAEPGLPERHRDDARRTQLYALLAVPDFASAEVAAEAILAGQERPGSDAALAGALLALGWIAWCQGNLTIGRGLMQAAVRRGDRGDSRGQHPRLWLATMLVAVGEFGEAATAVDQAAEEVGLAADTLWEPAVPLLRARLALAAGRVDDAVAEARLVLTAAEGQGLRQSVPLATVTLAQAALRDGDLSEAARWIERDRDQPDESRVCSLGATARVWVEAQLVGARDGSAAALRILAGWYESLATQPLLLLQDPAAAAWLTRVALSAGDRDRAEAVVVAAELLARSNAGLRSVRAAADHARALVDADPAAAQRAAGEYRHPWSAASAHEDAGVIHARGCDRTAARTAFEQALAGYEKAGANRDTARVRSKLRDLGVRPCHWARADRPTCGWASLTETERRVADIVAEGLTNPQVAERLFLSRHTVDFHLRQVFRKLGIRSRVELTRLVIQHDGDGRPSGA